MDGGALMMGAAGSSPWHAYLKTRGGLVFFHNNHKVFKRKWRDGMGPSQHIHHVKMEEVKNREAFEKASRKEVAKRFTIINIHHLFLVQEHASSGLQCKAHCCSVARYYGREFFRFLFLFFPKDTTRVLLLVTKLLGIKV